MVILTDGTVFQTHDPDKEGHVYQYKRRNKMVLKMFSIRDSKGDVYHPPMFKNTHGEAEREFRTAANNKDSMIAVYPEDYDLYYLGEYDNLTGKLQPVDTPQHMLKAVSVKQKQNVQ